MERPLRRLAARSLALVVAVATLAVPASAHVRYVVDDPADVASIVAFTVSTLTVPLHAAFVGGTGVALALGVVGYRRVRPFEHDVSLFTTTMADYRDLVPWLLRLSIGIPFVGAGFAGYYFTPLLRSDARLLFIGIGFLLLFGVATRFVAAVGLLVYLVGLVREPVLFLQFEYVGGLVAIALVGGGRPSADEVLDRIASDPESAYGRVDPVHTVAARFRDVVAPAEPYVPVVVRLSLGVTFVYLGLVEKLLAPGYALATVAKYDLTAIVPVAPELWVVGAALAEVAVGLVLLVGLYTRAAAALSLVLFTLTLFGLPDDPVLAHLSLFGLASMLLITGAGPLSVDRLLGDAATQES